MFVGYEQLPDDAMAKISPTLEELTFARITDEHARDQLRAHIQAQLLLYMPGLEKPNTESWDLAIEYASIQLRPGSLTHPRVREGEAPLAFRTWLRNLAAQVIDSQQRMIRSIAKKQIV